MLQQGLFLGESNPENMTYKIELVPEILSYPNISGILVFYIKFDICSRNCKCLELASVLIGLERKQFSFT